MKLFSINQLRLFLFLSFLSLFPFRLFSLEVNEVVDKYEANDIICSPASGTITIYFSRAINGQAQLRDTDGEVCLDYTGKNKLSDIKPTPIEVEGKTLYMAEWIGMKAGDYNIYYTDGDIQVQKINDSPISIKDDVWTNYIKCSVKATVENPYQILGQWEGGKFEVSVTDGEGPFEYSATVSRGGKKVYTFPKKRSEKRTFSFSSGTDFQLQMGDTVKVEVDDRRKDLCPSTPFVSTCEFGVEDSSPDFYVRQYLSRVYDPAKKRFDSYIAIYGLTKLTPELKKRYIDLFIKDAKLKNGVGSWSDVEYSLDTPKPLIEDRPHTYIHISDHNGEPYKRNYYINYLYYKNPVTGEQKNKHQILSYYLNQGMIIQSQANVTLDNCKIVEGKSELSITYWINGYSSDYAHSRWGGTKYYFPEGMQFTVEKKQKDGSWEKLDVEAPMNLDKPFSLNNFNVFRPKCHKLNLSAYGVGTYRLSYSDGDEQINISKEFTLEPKLKPELVGLSDGNLEVDLDNTTHGNTAAAFLKLKGNQSKKVYNIWIRRKDGKEEVDAEITRYLDDKNYTHKYYFPIFIPEAKFEYKADKDYTALLISDLPKGEYEVEIDHCGYTTVVPLVIDEVKKYVPKNDEGYRHGIRINKSCHETVIGFNFGTSEFKNIQANKNPYDSEWQNVGNNSSTTTATNSDEISIEKNESYKKLLTRTKPGGYVYSFEYITPSSNYSVAEDEYCNSAMMSDLSGKIPEEKFGKRVFRYVLESGSTGVFDVCWGRKPGKGDNNGVVTMAIRKGCVPSFPIHYELWKAKYNADNVAMPTEKVAEKTFEENDNKGNLWVKTDLSDGPYVLKSFGTYVSSTNSCAPQIDYVDITTTGLPQVTADWLEHCYENDLQPNILQLPVSEYMYNITWWDITDSENPKCLDKSFANNYAATFNSPGKYTLEARTEFCEDIFKSEGIDGGKSQITINVKKCQNYWVGRNLKTVDDNLFREKGFSALSGNDFFNSKNWTRGFVPQQGEDVIFATEENNPTTDNSPLSGPAKQFCFVSLPDESKEVTRKSHIVRVGKLINKTDKPFIVGKGVRLEVDQLEGFDTDASKLFITLNWWKEGTYTNFYLKNRGKALATVVDGEWIPAQYQTLIEDPNHTCMKKSKPALKSVVDNIVGSPTYGRTIKYYAIPWHYEGIPIKETSAAAFLGQYLQKYDETHNAKDNYYDKWQQIKTKEEKLIPFKGYQVSPVLISENLQELRGTKIQELLCKDHANFNASLPLAIYHSLEGELNVSDQEIVCTRQAAEVTASTSNKPAERHWGLGQNFIANSYSSDVDLTKIVFPAELEPTFYLFPAGTDFEVWHNKAKSDGTVYTAIPQKLASNYDPYLHPRQVALIHFTPAETKVGSPVSIQLNYSKAEEPKKVSNAVRDIEHKVLGKMKVELHNDTSMDRLSLFEVSGTTKGFERGWDATKMISYAPLMVSATTEEGELEVSTSDSITQHDISIRVPSEGEYTLTVVRQGLRDYDVLSLIDRETRSIIPFESDTLCYTFTVEQQSAYPGRFSFISANDYDFDNNEIIVSGIDNLISVGQIGNSDVQIQVFNLNGTLLRQEKLKKGQRHLRTCLPQGVYVVRASVNGHAKSTKMQVR